MKITNKENNQQVGPLPSEFSILIPKFVKLVFLFLNSHLGGCKEIPVLDSTNHKNRKVNKEPKSERDVTFFCAYISTIAYCMTQCANIYPINSLPNYERKWDKDNLFHSNYFFNVYIISSGVEVREESRTGSLFKE